MPHDPSPQELSPQQHEAIAAALVAGNKLEAIKLYRAATNGDLASSKAFVERLEAELRERAPERFVQPEKKGCLGLVVAGLALGWWI